MEIHSEEINYFKLTNIDEVGEVFLWRGKILRGIYQSAVGLVKEYFSSGFIDKIVTEGLFPKTCISEYTNPKYGLILEHERISPNTIDVEWSYDMYRDATLLVLQIARIGLRYGFNMKDCHTKNILFKNNRPMFVDLGSFVKRKGIKTYAPREGLHNYLNVLKIWEMGFPYIARNLQHNYIIPDSECRALFHPFLRKHAKTNIAIMKAENSLYSLLLHTDIELKERFNALGPLAKIFKKTIEFCKPFKCQRLKSLEDKIRKKNTPYWLSLPLIDENIELPTSIIKIISNSSQIILLNPYNQILVKQLSSFANIQEILGIDINEAKGNTNYNRYKNLNGYKITNVTYNIYTPTEIKDSFKSATVRFSADTFVVYRPEIVRNDAFIKLPLSSLFQSLRWYSFDRMVIITHCSDPDLSEDDFGQFFVQIGFTSHGNFNYYTLIKK